MWLLLSLAIFWQAGYVLNTALVPLKRLGLLQLMVNRMLSNDILTFMGEPRGVAAQGNEGILVTGRPLLALSSAQLLRLVTCSL